MGCGVVDDYVGDWYLVGVGVGVIVFGVGCLCGVGVEFVVDVVGGCVEYEGYVVDW